MTTPVQNQITQKLQNGLQVDYLEVLNESNMHNVPPNSETHFKVVAVSPDFADKRAVARHQMIYRLLDEELQGPVHALALHTYTPEEWHSRQSAPDSPQCRGGS